MRHNALEFVCFLMTLIAMVGKARAADDPDEALNLAISLVGDTDKELRAAGLQQVREGIKGTAATKKLTALLPKLSPEAQIGLLGALADRGDVAAGGAARDLIGSNDERVRVAAIGAVGALGDSTDATMLIKLLGDSAKPINAAARDALSRLRSRQATGIIIAALGQSKTKSAVDLINILAARRAGEATPVLLAAATDERQPVRQAAMNALGRLAEPDETAVAGMMRGILRADRGAERDAAETALKQVCDKIPDPEKRAAVPLAFYKGLADSGDQAGILPAIGRIGGKSAFEFIDRLTTAKEHNALSDAAVRALCLWPDASIADRLIDLTKHPIEPAQRIKTLQAVIRVAALHDKRSNADRLKLLKQAMELAQTDSERNLVVRRAGTIHTMDALHWVLPYIDQPAFAQKACESVAEMGHHRELREPNKAEFDLALDKVIKISRNPVTVDEAERYKKGETFNRANKKEE